MRVGLITTQYEFCYILSLGVTNVVSISRVAADAASGHTAILARWQQSRHVNGSGLLHH